MNTRIFTVFVAALMLTIALPTVAANDGEDEPPVTVGWCEEHTEDPFGQPTILPYPCVKKNTNGDDDPVTVEWCEEHVEDPFGQPTILPYPCKVHT